MKVSTTFATGVINVTGATLALIGLFALIHTLAEWNPIGYIGSLFVVVVGALLICTTVKK